RGGDQDRDRLRDRQGRLRTVRRHHRAAERPGLWLRHRLHGADDRLDGLDRVPQGLKGVGLGGAQRHPSYGLCNVLSNASPRMHARNPGTLDQPVAQDDLDDLEPDRGRHRIGHMREAAFVAALLDFGRCRRHPPQAANQGILRTFREEGDRPSGGRRVLHDRRRLGLFAAGRVLRPRKLSVVHPRPPDASG
ncbi:hypothetical protein chiPu_0032614, partial [Chiloscyllium punctatum]|nr:hypothetical protein [Chiloscyllium punctatum]